jgi:hypothetical protein
VVEYATERPDFRIRGDRHRFDSVGLMPAGALFNLNREGFDGDNP